MKELTNALVSVSLLVLRNSLISSVKVAITSTESSITRRSASNALASNRDYVVHLTRHRATLPAACSG